MVHNCFVPFCVWRSSKNRVPSYCDRVLWHVHKDAFTNVELSAKLERYTSIDEYTTSDHKPVVAAFTVQVNISHLKFVEYAI
jgi:hypothetical protein